MTLPLRDRPSGAPAGPAATPWPLVWLLVLAGIVAAFHVGKVPPSLPAVRAELGIDLDAAGWLISLINLIAAMGGMAIALTADRLGHRRLIVLGLGLSASASLAGAWAGAPATLFLLRGLEGLGFIVAIVSIPPLLMRISSARDVPRVLGLWGAYLPAGAGLMMLAAAALLPATGWRGVWIAAAIAGFAALAAVLAAASGRPELGRLPPAPRRLWSDMRETAGSAGPVLLGACFATYTASWFALVGFLPTLQIERLGFDKPTAAAATAGVAFANVTGNIAAGYLLRARVPRLALLAAAAATMFAASCGIFPEGLPDTARLGLAFVFSAVGGLIPGSVFAGVPAHAPRASLAGAANGLVMQCSSVGTLLGPPLAAAAISAGGWPRVVWLIGALLAGTVLAALALHRRERVARTRLP